MKYSTTFLLILGCIFSLRAQDYFSKTYNLFEDEYEELRNITIENGTVYATASGSCFKDSVEKCFKYVRFDTNGNLIDGFEDSRFASNRGMESDSNYFYVEGTDWPALEKTFAYRVAKDGSSSDLIEIVQDSALGHYTVSSISNDTHFVVYGQFDDLTEYVDGRTVNRAALQWIDKKSFSLDTTIYLPVLKRHTIMEDATVDGAGNFYFASNEKRDSPSGAETNYRRISKYNTTGELVWDYIIPKERWSVSDRMNIFILQDEHGKESILLTVSGEKNSARVLLMDTLGHVMWTREFDDNTVKSTIITEAKPSRDGNILVCGWQRTAYYSWINSGFLAKINAKSGEIIWERVYEIDKGVNDFRPGWNKANGFWDVEELPDGSIIGAGGVKNLKDFPEIGVYPAYDLWLLKVDSMGCMEPGCGFVQTIDNGVILKDSCKWLEERAEWFYTPWSLTPSSEVSKIEIVSDTVLGNRVCSVLGVIENGKIVEESKLIVFYEWETEHVYFYEEDSWKLLYDFSYGVFLRDTVEYYLPQNFSYYDISSGKENYKPSKSPYKWAYVEAEWIMVNDSFVRVIVAKPLPNADGEYHDMGKIICGVGSKSGFMGRGDTQATAGYPEYFRCHRRDNYFYSDVEECQPEQKYLSLLDSNITKTTYDYYGSTLIRYAHDSTQIDSNYYVSMYQSISQDGTNPIFKGYYRETNGKLYRRDNAHSKETLQVDMDAQVGDTLIIGDNQFDIHVLVDSVYYKSDLTGKNRKHVFVKCMLDSTFSQLWIEGIGATDEHSNVCYTDSYRYSIACAHYKDVQIYDNVRFDSCWYKDDTSTKNILSQNIRLFPNPAFDNITIDGVDGDVTGGVYSLYGTKLLSFKTKDIDIRELPQGVCFVVFFDSKKRRYVRKILKA